MTLVFKKHNGPTPADDIAPQIIRLWKLNTGLHATWAMSFSTFPPDSRTLVSKWNTKLALIWKEDFGPLGTVQFFFSLAQVRRLWCCLWFRGGLTRGIRQLSSVCVHWIYLIHEFHNLSWITEINELFHDILIYWDAPVTLDADTYTYMLYSVYHLWYI